MKYLLMIVVASLGSVYAFADTSTSTNTDEGRRRAHEVRFDCQFVGAFKGYPTRCFASGEVCVDRFDRDGHIVAADDERCDHRDVNVTDRRHGDNRVRIDCTNGFTDRDRAFARIFPSERGDDALVIRTREGFIDDWRQRDWIEIEDFDRFFRDRSDRDDDRRDHDDLRAKLKLAYDGLYLGRCDVDLERRRDRRDEDAPKPQPMQ